MIFLTVDGRSEARGPSMIEAGRGGQTHQLTNKKIITK